MQKNRAGFCAPLSAAFFAFVKKHPIVHLKETVRDRVNFYLNLWKKLSLLFLLLEGRESVPSEKALDRCH